MRRHFLHLILSGAVRQSGQLKLRRSEEVHRGVYLRRQHTEPLGKPGTVLQHHTDSTVPDDLAELPAIVGGKEMDFKYKDCKKEMDMVNKAFIETMIEGDANGRGFQYPIPTYSITSDFDWSDTENNRLLFEMTAKYSIRTSPTTSTAI